MLWVLLSGLCLKKTQEPMVPCFCHWFWHKLSAYYSKHWTLSWLSVKPSLSASHLFFETMCYHWNALLVVLKGGIVLLWDIFNYCFFYCREIKSIKINELCTVKIRELNILLYHDWFDIGGPVTFCSTHFTQKNYSFLFKTTGKLVAILILS